MISEKIELQYELQGRVQEKIFISIQIKALQTKISSTII